MLAKKFWRIQASATNPRSADLFLYGPISESTWWGDEITPKRFVDELQALGDIDELHVRINSGGGDVFAGHTIYSVLRSLKARVIVHIDGLAASIASVIAMAGDTVIMPRNANMMIHNPAIWVGGEADELRGWADVLDKLRDGIVQVYQAKSGMDRDELIKLMNKVTWMNADEALEYGFVDEVEDLQVAASVDADVLTVNGVQFDLAAFPVRPVFAEAPHPQKPKSENRGGKHMEITAQSVAEKAPAVHNEIMEQGRQAGITAERARLKAINELAVPGNAEVAQILAAAIESGETAEATALKVVAAIKKAPAPQATQTPAPTQPGNPAILAALVADAASANGVPAAPTPPASEDAERASVAKNIAEAANARRK